LIHFGEDTCGNLDAASSLEWLETNGIGGFASSTITGLNTRRYHGLLVAAIIPPAARMVLVSKLEETLVVDGQRFELSVNQYPGVVHPHGNQFQTDFRLDPFPTFTWSAGGVTVFKTVFMIHGENSTVVQYRLASSDGADVKLEVRPLVSVRDYHSLCHENSVLNGAVGIQPSAAIIRPYSDNPEIHFAFNAEVTDAAGYWYRNFEYAAERERGLDFTEDLYNPFTIQFDFARSEHADVIVSTEAKDVSQSEAYRESELERRAHLCGADLDEFAKTLSCAADQFIVARGEDKSVIAGYHWFGDWGRDTMISIPGLALCTGRPEVAKSILIGFAQYINRGMIPNRFPDSSGAPQDHMEYNNADATLWFFESTRALCEATGDFEFVRENLYAALKDSISWHVRGTRYGIHVDEDGLLHAGEEGSQLTWMDAKVDDFVVTPRRGKPVEIQALWYNALRIMEDLAGRFGDQDADSYRTLAERARNSFNAQFSNTSEQCLYDVIDGDIRDGSVRPNQIFAVSLPHTMLTPDRAQNVVDSVERNLLTPYGVRTLSPQDPKYRGRCDGDQHSRDTAYHQGTVWAWLIGPFLTARFRVYGKDAEQLEFARKLLGNFDAHLREAGLNQISEIFDGDFPHRPRGCIAQAWSVAEILRVATEITRAGAESPS
jgi:predicted glycogen debranching enzyme